MDQDNSPEALEFCQTVLGHRFADIQLLREALTHASIAQSRRDSNERLEFLGDAVLGLIVCHYLFETYPEFLEGELTKVKSAVVSRRTCAEIARDLGLTNVLFLGKGIGGRAHLPTSLAAAVLESLIGALFLDGGLEAARRFVLAQMVPQIEASLNSEHQRNFKSQLQQHAQKVLGSTPVYEVLDEKGPDHSKCFEIAVSIDGRRFRSAWGRSKKEAEQKAALTALIELNLLPAGTDAA